LISCATVAFHLLKKDKHYEERDDDLIYRKMGRMELKARKTKGGVIGSKSWRKEGDVYKRGVL
jgi:hypothetical protein